MNGKNVIDEMGRRETPTTDEADRLRAIDRMVSVSVLATVLRDCTLTYLTKD